MKKKIVFKDSFDESEISVSYDFEEGHYILDVTSGMHDVWLSPQDFLEFLDECKRLYQDNETRKNKQSEDEKL